MYVCHFQVAARMRGPWSRGRRWTRRRTSTSSTEGKLSLAGQVRMRPPSFINILLQIFCMCMHACIHTYIHTCIWTGMSDLYLVMCREEEGISCLLVPLHAQVFTGQDICMYVCMYVYRFVNSSCMYEQGLSFGQPEKKMGWNCQPTRQITFDNVRVPRENRSGLRNCLPVEIAQNNLFWCF